MNVVQSSSLRLAIHATASARCGWSAQKAVRRNAAATGKMPVVPVGRRSRGDRPTKKGGDPEDEEEAAEEERVVAEQDEERLFVELHVHAVQELLPERGEAVGEDGVNENRSCREGMERSVF